MTGVDISSLWKSPASQDHTNQAAAVDDGDEHEELLNWMMDLENSPSPSSPLPVAFPQSDYCQTGDYGSWMSLEDDFQMVFRPLMAPPNSSQPAGPSEAETLIQGQVGQPARGRDTRPDTLNPFTEC